jgi:hypothetical protein
MAEFPSWKQLTGPCLIALIIGIIIGYFAVPKMFGAENFGYCCPAKYGCGCGGADYGCAGGDYNCGRYGCNPSDYGCDGYNCPQQGPENFRYNRQYKPYSC